VSAYVRKTEGERREPGGLLCAVLTCVNDGDSTSTAIAKRLETSIDNVNGALGRLFNAKHVWRPIGVIPVVWYITVAGQTALGEGERWL
jgi:hypothetical protein